MVRGRLFDLSSKVRIPKEDEVSEPAAPAVDKVLDCAGMSCPLPVLKTARAIKELAPGQVLELLATDPGVEPDMQAWTSRTGNELLGIANQDGVFHVLIRRAR
jgi:tRNA 2-thiouridine synthesizing protein A